MKVKDSWHSERLGCEVNVARWGVVGVPFLIFPTAGGDAEEIERFPRHRYTRPLSPGGPRQDLLVRLDRRPRDADRRGNPGRPHAPDESIPRLHRRGVGSGNPYRLSVGGHRHRGGWLLDRRLQRVGVDLPVPEAFTHALCMSGTYDLERFLKAPITHDFWVSSPVHYLADLDGPRLEALRRRMILLPSGEGKAEDIEESWRVAQLLGSKAFPIESIRGARNGITIGPPGATCSTGT